MKKLFLLLTISASSMVFAQDPDEDTQTPEEGTQEYVEDYNAGLDAQNNGDYEGAVEDYLKALSLKPDFADAWNNLAYSYRKIAQEYLDKSGEAYMNALKYNPNLDLAIEYQGEYYLLVGKLKNAYANYQKLVQMGSEQAAILKKSIDAHLKQAQDILKSYSP